MPERYKVTGGSARWPLLIVLAAAALLAVIIWTGAQQPPAPEVAALSPTPAATPAAPTPFADTAVLYTLLRHDDGAIRPEIAAYGYESQELLAHYGSGAVFALSPDGQTLVIYDDKSASLRAVEPATGALRWSTSVKETRLQIDLLANQVLVADAAQVVMVFQSVSYERISQVFTLDLRSGALVYSYELSTLPYVRSLARDGDRLLLIGEYGSVWTLDLTSGQPQRVSNEDWLGAAWAAETRELYVVTADNQLRVFDAAFTQLRALPLSLPLAANATMRLMVDPTGTQLLTLATPQRMVEMHILDEGQLGVFYMTAALSIDPESGVVREVDFRNVETPHLLDIAVPDAERSILIGSEGRLYASKATRIYQGILPRLRNIQQVALGPGLNFAPPNTTPTPLPTVPVLTPTPEPEQLAATAIPLAWIWEASKSVRLYHADGSKTVIAADVVGAIARTDQPPLLLQGVNNQEIALFDPATGARDPLGLYLSNVYGEGPIHNALLSPDEQQLALLAAGWAESEEPSGRVLLLADRQQGRTRRIDLPQEAQVYDLELLGWDATGLYIAQHTYAGSAFVITLWHLDAATEQWEVAWQPDSPSLISLDPASATILYEPMTEQPAAAELYLYDLVSAESTLVYTGLFINAGNFSLAPGGEWAVYLAPVDQAAEIVQLYRYARASSSSELLPATATNCLSCSTLTWSADGAQLQLAFLPAMQEQAINATRQHIAIDMATGKSTLASPFPLRFDAAGAAVAPKANSEFKYTGGAMYLQFSAGALEGQIRLSDSAKIMYVLTN